MVLTTFDLVLVLLLVEDTLVRVAGELVRVAETLVRVAVELLRLTEVAVRVAFAAA